MTLDSNIPQCTGQVGNQTKDDNLHDSLHLLWSILLLVRWFLLLVRSDSDTVGCLLICCLALNCNIIITKQEHRCSFWSIWTVFNHVMQLEAIGLNGLFNCWSVRPSTWMTNWFSHYTLHTCTSCLLGIDCIALLLQLCGMDIIAIQSILHWTAMIISH